MHIWKQTCIHFWGFGRSTNMRSLMLHRNCRRSIFRCCSCLTSRCNLFKRNLISSVPTFKFVLLLQYSTPIATLLQSSHHESKRLERLDQHFCFSRTSLRSCPLCTTLSSSSSSLLIMFKGCHKSNEKGNFSCKQLMDLNLFVGEQGDPLENSY